MFSNGGNNSLIVRYMDSSFSLRQGRRLSSTRAGITKHVASNYVQSGPQRSQARSAVKPATSESTYDWLTRQYHNFFGKREAMNNYAFEGVGPGVNAANRRMEAEMQEALREEELAVSQYVTANTKLAASADRYANTAGSSSQYRNKFVKRDNGDTAYVTDRGALKSVGPYKGSVFNSIVGQRGCPSAVQNNLPTVHGNQDGTIGNNPSFFQGTPMGLNEPCGPAGKNVQVMGASLPRNNRQSSEWQCLGGVGGQFLPQTDIIGESAEAAFSQCHARAADIGASSFYVRKKNVREFPCYISKPGATFDGIAKSGTPASVEVVGDQWVAENRAGAGNEAAGILNDGTIAIGSLSKPGEADFAGAVDMSSTQSTVLADVAQGDFLKGKGCDPTKGAGVSVQGATLGNNCDGQKQEFPPIEERVTTELPVLEPDLPAYEPETEEEKEEESETRAPSLTRRLAPLEYHLVPKGAGACLAGTEITSEADCKAAAKAKGLVYAGPAFAHPDHIDCFQIDDGREKNNLGVAWAPASAADRAKPGGYFSGNYKALCEGPAPEPSGQQSPAEWQRANSVSGGRRLGDAQSKSECSELCREAGAPFCAYQCNGCFSGTSLAPRSEASFQSCFQYGIDMGTGTDSTLPVPADGYTAVVGDCPGNDISTKPELLPLSTYSVCPAIESGNAGQRITYVDLAQYKVGPVATSADCSQWDNVLYKDKKLEGKAGAVYMGKLTNRVNAVGDCKSACDADSSCAGFTWWPDRPEGWNCITKTASCSEPNSFDQVNFYTKTAGASAPAAPALSPAAPAPPPAPVPPAAPLPVPMDYWHVPRGGGACPPANVITSLAECKKAAKASGLVFGGGVGGNSNHIDCFQVHDGRKINNKAVYWAPTHASHRAKPGWHFNKYYSALCQSTPGESPLHLYQGPAGSVCPANELVGSVAQCQKATAELGLEWGHVVPLGADPNPAGEQCFRYGDGSNKVFWNANKASEEARKNPTGFYKNRHKPICQKFR